MSTRDRLLSTTILTSISAIFISMISASAADIYTKAPVDASVSRPAVDGFNWKLSGLGGSMGDRAVGGAQGSFSIPLDHQFGLQFDGATGTFDRRFFGAGAAHLFMRDPAQGLVGLYASHTYWNEIGGLHVTQFAGEGAAYLGRFTLQGIAGVEFGNSQSVVTGVSVTPPTTTTFSESYDIKTRFFDKIDLAYYVTDDAKVFVGHRYLGGKNALALGGELALPSTDQTKWAAFLEGRAGEGDFHGIWGGIRVYWGQSSKSLIARQREDDPNNYLPETLFSITNSQTQSSTSTITPDGDGDCDGDADGDC